VCVALILTGRGVFIGVQGWITDLVKLLTCQAVAGRSWSSVTTNIQLGIPLYCLLESFTVKPNHERLQGGAGWIGGMASRPPPGPTG
jgi:hypothetical protein